MVKNSERFYKLINKKKNELTLLLIILSNSANAATKSPVAISLKTDAGNSYFSNMNSYILYTAIFIFGLIITLILTKILKYYFFTNNQKTKKNHKQEKPIARVDEIHADNLDGNEKLELTSKTLPSEKPEYQTEIITENVNAINVILNSIGASQNSIVRVVDIFSAELTRTNQRIEEATEKTDSKIDTLMQAYRTLQNALDEKDIEVKRLREGYDSYLYRKYINRFLRVKSALGDIKKDQAFNEKSFTQIEHLLSDALEECGVVSFWPEIGSDYLKIDGVSDNPVKTQSANPEEFSKIAEVLEPGYWLVSDNHKEIIIPAKVRIFVEK
jgi:hypothetical protein